MIVKENITLYVCEHCNKRLLRKSAMEAHETKCNSNPINFRACSDCKFLEEIESGYWWDGYDGEHFTKTKGFKCNKLNIELYPRKADSEKDRYPESFENKEPFKKVCDIFENKYEF